MKITRVTAYAIKIPRNFSAARGTAGSPAPLRASDSDAAASDYHFAATYQTLYSTKIETALIKVETDSGIVGWGEAQKGEDRNPGKSNWIGLSDGFLQPTARCSVLRRCGVVSVKQQVGIKDDHGLSSANISSFRFAEQFPGAVVIQSRTQTESFGAHHKWPS